MTWVWAGSWSGGGQGGLACAVHEVTKSQTRWSNWTELILKNKVLLSFISLYNWWRESFECFDKKCWNLNATDENLLTVINMNVHFLHGSTSTNSFKQSLVFSRILLIWAVLLSVSLRNHYIIIEVSSCLLTLEVKPKLPAMLLSWGLASTQGYFWMTTLTLPS